MKPADLIKQLKEMELKPTAYSGRGMYGKECVGVSVDYIGDYTFPTGWSYDQLGKGYIVFWRSVAWPKGKT